MQASLKVLHFSQVYLENRTGLILDYPARHENIFQERGEIMRDDLAQKKCSREPMSIYIFTAFYLLDNFIRFLNNQIPPKYRAHKLFSFKFEKENSYEYEPFARVRLPC